MRLGLGRGTLQGTEATRRVNISRKEQRMCVRRLLDPDHDDATPEAYVSTVHPHR
jgi:hypothetical protein